MTVKLFGAAVRLGAAARLVLALCLVVCARGQTLVAFRSRANSARCLTVDRETKRVHARACDSKPGIHAQVFDVGSGNPGSIRSTVLDECITPETVQQKGILTVAPCNSTDQKQAWLRREDGVIEWALTLNGDTACMNLHSGVSEGGGFLVKLFTRGEVGCPAGLPEEGWDAADVPTCAAGFALAFDAGFSCSPCPAGTTSDETGTECAQCRAGTFNGQPGSVCAACPAGEYQNATGSTTCETCSAGAFSEPGQDSCELCAPGSYSAADGASRCTRCTGATFQPDKGATTCLPCPPGEGANTSGTACSRCAAGSFVKAGVCTTCRAGTISDIEGALDCVLCAEGFSSEPGSSKCEPCARGIAPTRGSVCELCPPGQRPDANRRKCEPCALDDTHLACTSGADGRVAPLWPWLLVPIMMFLFP